MAARLRIEAVITHFPIVGSDCLPVLHPHRDVELSVNLLGVLVGKCHNVEGASTERS